VSSTRKRGALSALAITAVTGLAISGLPNSSAAPLAAPNRSGDISGPLKAAKERPVNYDSRSGTVQSQAAAAAAIVAKRDPGFAAFAKSLGSRSMMDYDGLTGTPRNLGRLDGYLTGPSSASAESIALGYVRAHLADLGLSGGDLSTFKLRQDYVDIDGIHHVSWTQSARGITVFSNGLKANVSKTGQLISIQGSPISGLAAKASAVSTTPRLSAAEARATAAADVKGKVSPGTSVSSSSATLTKWSNQDQAQLVWFMSPTGLQLGWSTYVQAGGTLNFQHVIDAATGRVLYRHDTTNFDRGDALVFENYPGAPVGGTQHVVNLYQAKFLPKTQTTWLRGQYVVAWSDVNDDNQVNPGERTRVPGTVLHATKKLVPFNPLHTLCSKQYKCTWSPKTPFSWRVNRAADVAQGFYYDSVYHNYLAAAPFGFTSAAGNFELRGGDPVLLNDLDGADSAGGLPDGGHIDNANMSTPPDGISPTMQMYLLHFPGTGPIVEPYVASSSTFDPSVILHEYTHGLSNRLVVDAQGNSTLNSIQSGAMGEAWSDYYALDYLVTKGLQPDSAADGDLFEAHYWLAGHGGLRTEPIDCPVGSTAPTCVQPVTGEAGGYTYGEFPIIGGAPEVHASGEVWAQALWSLRGRLGHTQTDAIVTRAMELAPNDPTMLDMRNAIVQANQVVYAGSKTNQIWHTFATRGMGWFAGTIDAGDAFPQENFKLPPAPETPRGNVVGVVKDATTGDPIGGALVAITGHSSGFTGDYSAVTNPDGSYTIPNVFIGTYALARVTSPGYEVISGPLKVDPGSTVANFSPRRDWAAASGGGVVTAFNGPDYSSFNCGPTGSIDLSQGTGWGSTTGDDAGTPTDKMIPKYVTIKLASTTKVTSFAVNPANTCGDPGSSSTGRYRIETSPDGTTWSTALKGRFDATMRHLNQLSIDQPVSGVNYVKFWMLSPQVPDFHTTCPLGNFGGCTFTDMTEIEVFGTS
jgi:extracellular elastinolytic metalloproteinase